MIIEPCPLPGACTVDLERLEDERGFFARSWSAEEFAAHGLEAGMTATSVSFNARRGTLRGLHFQAAPHAETKLVRCTMGRIFDVIVDLRESSPTYCRWFGTELSSSNRRAMYVPRGFAHGFQTLEDGSEVLYYMHGDHVPAAARGWRWDDPAFAIDWPPADDRTMSDRDATYPDFVRAETAHG